MKALVKPLAVALVALATTVNAEQSLEVTMNRVSDSGVGEKIGVIKIEKAEHGVLLTPDLTGLDTGLHGFHVHQNPDCSPKEQDGQMKAALAAGGHLDPNNAGSHDGPFEKGHLGDLPALYVDESGKATHPVLAPRLDLKDLQGRSLMIHKGGDNYSDEPAKLGGGGPRVACGVISQKGGKTS